MAAFGNRQAQPLDLVLQSLLSRPGALLVFGEVRLCKFQLTRKLVEHAVDGPRLQYRLL